MRRTWDRAGSELKLMLTETARDMACWSDNRIIKSLQGFSLAEKPAGILFFTIEFGLGIISSNIYSQSAYLLGAHFSLLVESVWFYFPCWGPTFYAHIHGQLSTWLGHNIFPDRTLGLYPKFILSGIKYQHKSPSNIQQHGQGR